MSKGPWKRKAGAKGVTPLPLPKGKYHGELVLADRPNWAAQYEANHTKRHPDPELLVQEWCSFVNSTTAPILAKSFLEHLSKYGFHIEERA
jgi:hypothetical protein